MTFCGLRVTVQFCMADCNQFKCYKLYSSISKSSMLLEYSQRRYQYVATDRACSVALNIAKASRQLEIMDINVLQRLIADVYFGIDRETIMFSCRQR